MDEKNVLSYGRLLIIDDQYWSLIISWPLPPSLVNTWARYIFQYFLNKNHCNKQLSKQKSCKDYLIQMFIVQRQQIVAVWVVRRKGFVDCDWFAAGGWQVSETKPSAQALRAWFMIRLCLLINHQQTQPGHHQFVFVVGYWCAAGVWLVGIGVGRLSGRWAISTSSASPSTSSPPPPPLQIFTWPPNAYPRPHLPEK